MQQCTVWRTDECVRHPRHWILQATLEHLPYVVPLLLPIFSMLQLMEQRRRGVLTQQQSDHVSNTLSLMPSVACNAPAAACFMLLQLMEQRRRGVLTQQQIDHVSNTLRGWRWDARVRAPPLNEMIQLLQDFVQQQGRLPRQYEVRVCVGIRFELC